MQFWQEESLKKQPQRELLRQEQLPYTCSKNDHSCMMGGRGKPVTTGRPHQDIRGMSNKRITNRIGGQGRNVL